MCAIHYIAHAVSRHQLLLHLLLLGSRRTTVLSIVKIVVGLALAKLKRRPVLWIGVIGSPRCCPHLQAFGWSIARGGCFCCDQGSKVKRCCADIYAEDALPLLPVRCDFVVEFRSIVLVGDFDGWDLRNTRPTLFLH